MQHAILYQLREIYNRERILLCFNGPFSQGLIEEIGNALKNYLQSEAHSSSSAMDVFAAYIEIAQNIQRYTASQGYEDLEASGTVVINRDEEGRYVITAGNIIETGDGETLAKRVEELAALDKAQLKAAYRERMRQPRERSDTSAGAGLGLIDIARKSALPFSCSLRPDSTGQRSFFSLRVVIG